MSNVRRRIEEGGDYYTTTTTAVDNLDDNLLAEILIRLPAKTVVRFKVINKRWYSLISHPFFVNKHTSLQTSQDASSFILEKPYGITLVSFDRPSSNLFSETALTLGLPHEDVDHTRSCILATSHGLILVEIGYDIYIYNPLTKKKQLIPSPCIGLPCYYGIIFGPTSSSPHYYSHYNLVCLVEADEAFKFKIFTPEKGRWRDSNKSAMISYGTNGLKKMSVCLHTRPVCFRGIMYTLTETGYIIAFHLDKEESRMIEIPKSVSEMLVGLNRDWRIPTWLGVVEDEVNLVVVTQEQELVIWVLHDYENSKWKIKKKDMIKPGNIPIAYVTPLFFDGQRLVLNATTTVYKYDGNVQQQFPRDITLYYTLTGVSKLLCSHNVLRCTPNISTLTGICGGNQSLIRNL